LIAQRLIILALALALAVQVIRNAAVQAFVPLYPASAARLWPGHPATEISLALAEIGRASRARQPINPQIFALINDAAMKSPLSPEPFLIRGIQAQNAANENLAMRAFRAAQWRDPRSLPAAYFLADYHLRVGNASEGLTQAALLARLSPGGVGAIAPYVAAYARDPAHWAQVRGVVGSQPELQDAVLATLAQDPRNIAAILALADKSHRKPDSLWLPVLLSKLIESGNYTQAHSLWSSIGGGRASELVFDTGFAKPLPPPPFNWVFSTSNVGLAERQPGGRLHVIFYGNIDGVLASQLILLPRGRYRLETELSDQSVHADALRWSIRCAKNTDPFASVGIDEAASKGWTFEVPADCPAQWLELAGRSGDVAQQAEVTISELSVNSIDG